MLVAFGSTACTHPLQQASITGKPTFTFDKLVKDSSVPGGQRGEFTVRNGDLQQLREQLGALFDSPDMANAELRFNTGPDPICEAGPNDACLHFATPFQDQFFASPKSPQGVQLFANAPWPRSVLVGTPGATALFPIDLNDGALEGVSVALRQFAMPNPAVRPGLGGPARLGRFLPTAFTPADSTTSPPIAIATCDDTGQCSYAHPNDPRFRVKVLGGQTQLRDGGAGPHSIAIPIELEFVGGWTSQHFCETTGFDDVVALDAAGNPVINPVTGLPQTIAHRRARGTFGGVACAAILDQIADAVPGFIGEDCDGIKGFVTIASLRMALTLTPAMNGTCSGPSNETLRWTSHFPGLRDLSRMGCLEVRPGLASLQQVKVAKGAVTEGVGVRFSAYGCGTAIDTLCDIGQWTGLGSCEDSGNATAAARANAILADQLRLLADQQLTRFLRYAPTNGPFQSDTPPICSLTDPACTGRLEDHYLPATITGITNSWFANPVVSDIGPLFKATQYTGVESLRDPCPIGSNAVLAHPGEVSQPAVSEDRVPSCAKCPTGTTLAADDVGDQWQCHEGPGAALVPAVVTPREISLRFSVNASDADGDGIIDAQDSCPALKNAGDVDSDGDGVGDACDGCPNDPLEWNPKIQADGDGICGGIDNCPTVKNADQDNLNREVEQVRQAERLGDACETVPVPDFSFSYTTTDKYNCVPKQGVEFCTVQDIVSDLTLVPRGPRSRASGQMTPVQVDGTDLRYCFPGADALDRCTDKGLLQDFLANVPLAGEDASTAWRRITTRQFVPGTFPLPPISLVYDRSVSKLGAHDYADITAETFRWLWQDDKPVWKALIGEDPRQGGRFWTHGRTNVGMKGSEGTPLAMQNGLHNFAPGSPQAGAADGLSNVYKALSPDATRLVLSKVNYQRPFGWERICLACEVTDPRQWKRDPWLERAVRLPGGVPLTFGGDSVAYLTPQGAVISAEVPITLAAQELLSTPGTRRAVSADPNPLAGKGSSQPQSMVVSSRGQIVGGLYFGLGGMLASSDLQIGDGESVHVFDRTTTEAPAGFSLTLPPSTGAELLYSSSDALLFSVGGAVDGRESGEVWKAQVDQGLALWRKLAVPSGTLGHVVASTYQPSRTEVAMGRVWALDESGSGWGKKARLWVVNAESGQATKLAEWPRLGLFNQHWLTVDRDGSVLLTASSELLRVHAVFRIDTDSQGRLTTTVVRVEKGWLTAAPSVDVAGYGFLVQAKPGVLPVPANVTSLRVDRPQYTSPGSCL